MYSKLFSPMKIGGCEIKNRIVMSPMLMGFGQIDGRPTEMLMDYYEERAKGGTGLIIVVGVALETVKQLEGQMTQKSYKRFFE